MCCRIIMSSSQAMAGLKLAVLLVLVNVAAGSLTIQETVENGCTSNVDILCKQLAKAFAPQTLLPGESSIMSVTSTLDDPNLTCDFSSLVVPDLKVKKTVKIWEYLKSGFTDNPEMSCTNGCLWKAQDDGLYYRAADGTTFVSFIKWAAVIPGTV